MDAKKTRKHLTPKELAVLRTNTKLSDKEINLCYEAFLQNNSTGKLDQNTFASLSKEFGPPLDTETFNAMFKMMDKDGNGTIDFDEFLFATAVLNLHGDLDDRLDFIFDFWDVSNDGQLDQNELGHLISAMYDRARVKDRQGDKDPHKRAKAIITKLDINHDKKLSREEFINGCKHDEVIAKLLAPTL